MKPCFEKQTAKVSSPEILYLGMNLLVTLLFASWLDDDYHICNDSIILLQKIEAVCVKNLIHMAYKRSKFLMLGRAELQLSHCLFDLENVLVPF